MADQYLTLQSDIHHHRPFHQMMLPTAIFHKIRFRLLANINPSGINPKVNIQIKIAEVLLVHSKSDQIDRRSPIRNYFIQLVIDKSPSQHTTCDHSKEVDRPPNYPEKCAQGIIACGKAKNAAYP
jgi:hypothetical protein